MAQYSSMANKRRIPSRDALIATCDQCASPMILLTWADTLEHVVACPLCRHYHPLAEVLMAKRRVIRRVRPHTS